MEFLGEDFSESCCFCRSQTGWWTEKQDVACCMECADKALNSAIPTKEEWLEKERQLEMLESELPYGKSVH